MNGQIKKGALISYIALFINIVIGLCYTPWVIKSIGKQEYGLYSLALSVISLFLFDFGLSSAVTRFLSKYLAENNKIKVNNFMGITIKLYLFADIIILIVLSSIFIFIPSIYHGLTQNEIEKFKVIFFISSTFSILSFPFIPLNGILIAYEKIVQLKICDLLNKILIVALMSACLMSGMGLYALVSVNAIAGLCSIFLKLYFVKKYTDLDINWTFWDKKEFKAIFSFSSWVMIMGICQRCVMNICPSILGVLADSNSIAIFSVSMAIEGIIFSFANAINGLLLPKVSRMIAIGDEQNIQNLMIRVGRLQIFIIGLIFMGFIVVGRLFIHLWLGYDYDPIYFCVILMVIPSFIHLPQEIASTTIVAKNEVKSQAIASILKGATNLLFALPLVYFWGIYGMAFSIFLSYSIYVIYMNVIYVKRLHIDIKYFFSQTFFKMLPSLVVSSTISYSITLITKNIDWYTFIIYFFSTFILYLIIVGYWGLNKSEQGLIKSFLRK